MNIKNIAFYSFFKPNFELGSIRDVLRRRMDDLGIRGTILLAPEGLNCSLSGISEQMDDFLEFLLKKVGITKPELKISYSQELAFKRSLVKIKSFIVAKPGLTPLDLAQGSAPCLSPEE